MRISRRNSFSRFFGLETVILILLRRRLLLLLVLLLLRFIHMCSKMIDEFFGITGRLWEGAVVTKTVSIQLADKKVPAPRPPFSSGSQTVLQHQECI